MPMRQRAADHADEDHQRRRGEAAAHHDGLEHIVGERRRTRQTVIRRAVANDLVAHSQMITGMTMMAEPT